MNGYRTSYVTPAIRVVDAPISRKSPEQWKAIVEYKALAFTHDNQYASIAYDLKSSRAVFDPNLAGGNGGFRCPVGTRYGGQITDRYGRGCGFGVARRLVNAIGDTARRAERGMDKRRERRVQRRNARVGRQIGVRGYTAPARAGRGMATRLEDFADRRDRRQRRGRGRVPSGPGVATRLENFADRRDRRQGRGGRGVATRLEDFADRRDRRQGRGRGIATRLEDFADRDDRRRGIDVPERAPRTPKRPAAPNRRSRRTEAVAEAATNRPRPKKPSTPVAEVKPPQRRQRGPRVNVDDLNSAERTRLNDALDRERDALNAKWKTRLGGEDPTPEKIRAYVEAREQRSKPAYVNTLKAMERDHAILNGEDRLDQVNDLAPSVRKRIIGGSIEDQGNARPQPPRAPRRPVKKRVVKKAPAKRPAKKAPAKKAPAKKAAAKKVAATRPENSVPDFLDLNTADRRFVYDALENQGLIQSPQEVDEEIDRQAAILNADGLDDLARVLENGARDDRRKARSAARPDRERAAYQAIAERKEGKAQKLRQRAEVERVRAGNEPPSAPGAPGNAPEAPDAPSAGATKPEAPEVAGKPRRNILGLARRKDKRDRAKLGTFDKNGFADPKRVEVGNKGITDKAKATKYLKDGGNMADVPDEFLADAIRANLAPEGAVNSPKRFIVTRKPHSANSPTLFKDTKTGQDFALKTYSFEGAYGYNEDMNDIIGNHLAERFGFPNGQMRFAGELTGPPNSPKTTAPIVIELGGNFVDGNLQAPSQAQFDIKNLLRATLFDYAIINSDRHTGNFFSLVKDGKHYFFPIDQSLGFNGRRSSRYFDGGANLAGLGNWLGSGAGGRRSTNVMLTKLQGKMDAAGRREVIAEIKKLQVDLRKAERQESSSAAIRRMQGIFPGRKYATTEGRAHKEAADRIKWLISARPEDIANAIERGR